MSFVFDPNAPDMFKKITSVNQNCGNVDPTFVALASWRIYFIKETQIKNISNLHMHFISRIILRFVISIKDG